MTRSYRGRRRENRRLPSPLQRATLLLSLVVTVLTLATTALLVIWGK